MLRELCFFVVGARLRTRYGAFRLLGRTNFPANHFFGNPLFPPHAFGARLSQHLPCKEVIA